MLFNPSNRKDHHAKPVGNTAEPAGRDAGKARGHLPEGSRIYSRDFNPGHRNGDRKPQTEAHYVGGGAEAYRRSAARSVGQVAEDEQARSLAWQEWESQLLERERSWEKPQQLTPWMIAGAWAEWLAKGFLIFAVAYVLAHVVDAFLR